jgi:type VI secretion system secreted protein VgrG
MVIADSPSAFKPCPLQSSANYSAEVGLGAGAQDFVSSWESSHQLRTGSYTMWDWHFEKSPSRFEYAIDTEKVVAGNTAYKLSDFPGRYIQQFNDVDSVGKVGSEGDKLTRLRMEEIETDNPLFRGTSNCRGFSAGFRFKLAGGPAPGDYVVTSIDHTGSQSPPYVFGMESGVIYTNAMTCIPHGTRYRPPRLARRSLTHGPQTALVIDGPDKYGRMKVKFHWGDDESSGWVRVAQFWAGQQWGAVFLPRVGHEVLVDFVDGDPDHPIIVGSLYNAENMPPYPLPDKYSYSTIKTYTDNELRFDDTEGAEDIYFHAQKDFHRVVENDDDLKVENNQTIKINKGNRDTTLEMGNDTLTIKMGNHIQKINLGKSETEAMQSIELKVGANSIKIDQAGITLDGIMIKLKGKAMIDSQAPMQKMNGDAMIMIKGGITMIN